MRSEVDLLLRRRACRRRVSVGASRQSWFGWRGARVLPWGSPAAPLSAVDSAVLRAEPEGPGGARVAWQTLRALAHLCITTPRELARAGPPPWRA